MRKLLRFLLKKLSRWAIRKHGMSVISVVGNHYTKLTGEILNQLLSEKYPCRFEYEKPFWDFSIPLAILGVEDRRYSVFGWINVLITSFLRLLFLPSNFTYTILQLSTKYPEIINYWMDIISPEISFILEPLGNSKDITKVVTQRTQKNVYYFDPKNNQVVVTSNQDNPTDNKISKDVSFNKHKETVVIKFRNNEIDYEFKSHIKTSVVNNSMILCITYLVNDGWTVEEIQRALDLIEINFDHMWKALS